MEELNQENVEYCEAEFVDENYDNYESGNAGLIGVGVGLLAVAGAAGAAFVANKMGKLDGIKERRREKKIAKLEAKLDKEYTKIQEVEAEPVETETEEEK